VQVGGTVQGASNIPRRGRRLQALLAVVTILVIAAAMALLVWVFPPATSGDGAQGANPNAGAAAGAAVVHDDAGNMPPELYYPLPHGKVANPDAGAGSGIVHDDAGNVR
jgi:uncharacterized RDD family membrane protein YckC